MGWSFRSDVDKQPMDNNCYNGQEIKVQRNNWLTAGFSVMQTRTLSSMGLNVLDGLSIILELLNDQSRYTELRTNFWGPSLEYQ